MRRRLFEILESAKSDDKPSQVYDFFLMAVIIVSLVPLAFKENNGVFLVIDKTVAVIFIIDYILRWITADYKCETGKFTDFVKYPLTPMAIIDLLSILPSLIPVNGGLRLLKVFRLVRSLRVLRVFKAMRYSRSIRIITEVLHKEKESLTTVFMFALAYILISALVIFNVEPDTFDTFFDAVYWATISLTTMGYGDIYPVSTTGRIVTMLSSLVGIAIVALPASIITAGYMDVVKGEKE